MLGSVGILPDEVARSCCGALVAWVSCVPPKNARRARLRSSIKVLIRDVCSSVPSVNRVGSQSVTSVFGHASSKSGDIGETKVLEAAAFLVMFSHIAESHVTASPDSCSLRRLGEDVWKLTSDSSMRSNQEALLARTPMAFDSTFTASGMRIYISAKTISFLCLVALGFEPWSAPDRNQRYSTTPSQESTTESDFAFFASCLASCLACACLGTDAREVAVSVASMIGLLISRAHQLMSNANDGVMPRSIGISLEKLRDELPHMLFPTLCHCISSTINTSCIGAIESFLFESFLGLVQVVAAFVRRDDTRVINSVPGVGGPGEPLTANEDPRRAIGVSLLDEIDETIGERNGLSLNELLRQVRDCIIGLIEEAKPSVAFSIRISSALSSQAKCLVTRHNASMCRALAAIAAAEGVDACTALLARLFSAVQAASNSPDDLNYLKLSTRRVLEEMILVSDSSKCAAEAIVASTDQVIRLALESLVDSKPLESLPTCNLTRIRASCGESGEKLEFSRLLEIADEKHVSYTKETTSMWRFAASLGKCLSSFDTNDRLVALGSCLVSVDREFVNLRHDLRPLSLECECFQRFRFFRAMVSCGEAVDLSWMVSIFVPSSTSILKQLDEALAASQEVRDATMSGLNHRVARMLEVFDCYLCFHVSVVAWILRMGSSSCSPAQTTLMQSLGDDYMRRSLQKKPVVAVQSGSTGKHPLEAIYPRSILHRCRELLIYASQVLSRSDGESPGSLFDALLAAALEADERGSYLFCRAFCSRPHLVRLSQDCPPSDTTSPLSVTIDAYLERVEASAASQVPPVDVAALLKLKRFLLKRLVAPRLCLNLSESNRIGLLRLLRNLLELEREELADIDDQPRLDIETLALLARGLRVILQNALASSVVSEDIVTSVYRCGLAMANLPSATVDQRAVGWLVDWCDDAHSDFNEYLRSFFDWLREVGEKIVDTSNPEPLQQYVGEMQGLKALHWDAAAVAARPLAQSVSWQHLVALENRVCPVSGHARPISNAYYASRQATKDGETPSPSAWVPSRGLRLVVNLLVGKVQCSRESSTNENQTV
jgi:hypothetical protein